MPADPKLVESVFHRTAALPPADRAAFLAGVCGDDPDLRQRVERLLAAHAELGQFLDRPADGDTRTALPPSPAPAEPDPVGAVGAVVAGRYKLLEEIGEGGMGSVWMAEQREPVKRLVAVKLIKPGMDSRSVLARFEAERQALALMDHPGIAKVLDGGTERGRPFFVMELVKGVPLTEYCDARRLSVRDRLDLFVQVCSAVQHAHMKGVIHRDLKPTNILVTEHDGTPVPKVIDFGLAKALHGTGVLTDKTLHTSFGAVVGTPLYMAPEQVGINALDVDTRTDIYALGVILYELLTGTTPLERGRLKEALWDEVRRLIREDEPPRPSTRLSTSDALPAIAARRHAEPAKLSRLVRGELDWIVMKALEKDRSRRYETANGLAMDVRRHLAGEPVLAVPPSAGYRLRKFARRHRAAMLTAAAFAAVLVAATAVSGWQAVRATRAESAARESERQAYADREAAEAQKQLAERREAEARENERKARAAEAAARESDETAKGVLQFVEDHVLAAPRPAVRAGKGLGREVTLRQALDAAEPKIAAAFADRPRVEARLRYALGVTYGSLGEQRLALTQYERAYALAKKHIGPDDPLTVWAEFAVAGAYLSAARPADGFALLEQSLARRQQALGPDHPRTVDTIAQLIMWYSNHRRTAEARKLGEELLQVRLRQHGDPEADRQWEQHVLPLSYAYGVAGRRDEAARVLEGALPGLTERRGPDDDLVLEVTSRLALLYSNQGRYADAVALYEPAYPRAVDKYGLADNRTRSILQMLSVGLPEVGRTADAVRLLEAVLPELRQTFGPANSHISPHVINLTHCYGLLGRHRAAVELLEATIAAIPEAERGTYVNYNFLLRNLKGSYAGLGELAQARRVGAELLNRTRRRRPPGSLELANGLARVAVDDLGDRLYADAEVAAREALAIREARIPDGWPTFNNKTLVGIALLGQKKYAEAEPLLIAGYEGLTARRHLLPPPSATQEDNLSRAGWQLALLYDRTGRPEKAAAVRAELPRETAPRPRPVRP